MPCISRVSEHHWPHGGYHVCTSISMYSYCSKSISIFLFSFTQCCASFAFSEVLSLDCGSVYYACLQTITLTTFVVLSNDLLSCSNSFPWAILVSWFKVAHIINFCVQLANLVGFVVGPDGMKLLASRMLSRESEWTTTSLLKLHPLCLVSFSCLFRLCSLNLPLSVTRSPDFLALAYHLLMLYLNPQMLKWPERSLCFIGKKYNFLL